MNRSLIERNGQRGEEATKMGRVLIVVIAAILSFFPILSLPQRGDQDEEEEEEEEEEECEFLAERALISFEKRVRSHQGRVQERLRANHAWPKAR